MVDQHRAGLQEALVVWREGQADKLNLRSSHILPDSEVDMVDPNQEDGTFCLARRRSKK